MKRLIFALCFCLIFIISRQICCQPELGEESVIVLTEAPENKTPNDLKNNVTDVRNKESVDLLKQTSLDVPTRELSISSTRTSVSTRTTVSTRTIAEVKKEAEKRTRVQMNNKHYYLDGKEGRKHRVELSGSVSANILVLEDVIEVSKYVFYFVYSIAILKSFCSENTF